MKKIFLSILVFFFNVASIYALSFNIETTVEKTNVHVGSKVNVDVSLNDIKDTTSGIGSCELKILVDDGIVLDGNIKTYGSWKGDNGTKGYLFDTTDAILSNAKVFTIPLIINKSGQLKIIDIVCMDVDDNQANDEDIIIKFNVNSDNSSSSKSSSSALASSSLASSKSSSKASSSSKSSVNNKSSNSSKKSSSSSSLSSSSTNTNNVYLADIKITGGNITFVKDNFEYRITVADLDNFSIDPIVENADDIFAISESFESEEKKFEITVWNSKGDSQKYNLYVIEDNTLLNNSSSDNVVIDKGEKKDYSGIFITIIIILIMINVGRIGYKMYKNKK